MNTHLKRRTFAVKSNAKKHLPLCEATGGSIKKQLTYRKRSELLSPEQPTGAKMCAPRLCREIGKLFSVSR